MTYEKIIDAEIIRGNKWDGITFSVAKADVDYTGATIKVQVREAADRPVLVEKTITPTTAELELIEFVFDLDASETEQLNGNAVADIRIAAGTDIKSPILVKFKVTKNITK